MTYLDKERVCFNLGGEGREDNLEETEAKLSSDGLGKTVTFLNPKYLLICDTLLSIITRVLTNSIKRFF